MLERAIVKSTHEAGATVVLCTDQSCSSCQGCRLFDGRKPVAIETTNPEGLTLRPGDLVHIHTPPGRAITAAFQVLILPLILFGAGYGAAALLGAAGEALRVLAGVAGLFAGLAIAAAGGRKPSNLPRVVAVHPAATAGAEVATS